MLVSRKQMGAAVAACFGFGSIAYAAEQMLPEVKVQPAPLAASPVGPDEGYKVERSTTATKTDTPIFETPQSITVVTRERIENQNAQNLQDALNYAAGVRSDAYGLDSRVDSVRIRGANPAEYRDGLRRQLGGFYTSGQRVEPYTLERIEVLRGPSSMLYGQGSTAGVINMVTKRPLAEPLREVGVSLGNYGHKQLQADVTGPLTKDGQWLYRLVAVGRDSDTQVDFIRDDRKLLMPSLTWRPNAATSLTLQALYQENQTGSTLQFLPWSGTVLPNPNGRIPTNRFIGEPNFERYDVERYEAGYLFEHRLNERFTFRQNVRLADNKVDYQTIFPNVFARPNSPFIDPAQRVVNRIAYVDKRDVGVFTADQHLQLNLATGLLQHTVLLGFDYARQTDRLITGGAGAPAVPPIDVFNPVYTGYAGPPLAARPKTTLRQTGIYLQDQMKWGQRLILVGGVRRDDVTNGVVGAADQDSHDTTFRVGAMYLLDGGFAPYVSYSESFTPVAGTNLFGQRFEPLKGEQVELGLKWESADKRLGATAAVYELEELNRLVPDPTNPLNRVQTGFTRNRGLELELIGRLPQRIDVSAHYNYIDIDPQLEAIPQHQIAVWGTKRFVIGGLTGFIGGLGVRYFSEFQDGRAPVTPDVTLVDGLFGYDSGRWRYALNVQNIADKSYVSTCLGRGDCFYGARRTVIASARYRF